MKSWPRPLPQRARCYPFLNLELDLGLALIDRPVEYEAPPSPLIHVPLPARYPILCILQPSLLPFGAPRHAPTYPFEGFEVLAVDLAPIHRVTVDFLRLPVWLFQSCASSRRCVVDCWLEELVISGEEDSRLRDFRRRVEDDESPY